MTRKQPEAEAGQNRQASIRITCSNFVLKPVNEIIPYARNAKVHSQEQIRRLRSSLREFGFVRPLLIDGAGNLIAGHGTLEAAVAEGMGSVPCVLAEGLTDQQRKAYILADNRLSELAPWDNDMLQLELEELSGLGTDLDMIGFDLDKLGKVDVSAYTRAAPISGKEEPEQNEDSEVFEDAYSAKPPNDPRTKAGDLWRLGRHMLLCGDATNAEDVARLMAGEKACMGFFDPPYGMGKARDGVLGDNQNKDSLLSFNKTWIPLSLEALDDVGSWYCWGIDEPLMDIYSEILKPMIRSKNLTWRNLLTWNKGFCRGQLSPELRMYPIADEKCLFVMKGRQTTTMMSTKDDFFDGYEPIRTALEAEAKKAGLTPSHVKEICGVGMYSHWFTRSQWTLIPEEHYKKLQAWCRENDYDAFKADYDAFKADYDAKLQEWYATRAFFDNTHEKMTSVWSYTPVLGGMDEYNDHPTQKPVALCARAIRSSCPEGGIVADFFGGSGSTLIACEQTGRACRMMELSPRWCDLIIDRWETMTGEKAALVEP